MGSICMLATIAVFMPTSWHDWCHQALGLGRLPGDPVVEYMARSLSGFYALLGALLWLMAGDLSRYRVLVWANGVAAVAVGLLFMVMDRAWGLPRWWAISEGPVVLAYGALVLGLQMKLSA